MNMTPTRVTLTGTGVPPPAPGRAGAGTLVQHGDTILQFDAGRATTLRLVESGVRTGDLSALFLTHHHSDHCVDVADIVFTRWIQRSPELTVLAPDGPLTTFGRELLDLWREDLSIRERVTGRDPLTIDWRAFPATTVPTVVWKNDDVTVHSVLVEHPPVAPAVAYRVDAGSVRVVVSGDTKVCRAVEELATGADVLVHEVALREAMPPGADDSVYAYHADAYELGAMAQRAGVRTLALTHLLPAPRNPAEEAAFADRVRAGGFEGEVLVGRDLMEVVVEPAGVIR